MKMQIQRAERLNSTGVIRLEDIRRLHVLVPYDAGGGTDTVMRALADAAKGSLEDLSG